MLGSRFWGDNNFLANAQDVEMGAAVIHKMLETCTKKLVEFFWCLGNF